MLLVVRELGAEIARGTRSTVHAWGDDAVIKVPHADTPDEWIGYEATYTAAVHAVGAPVPRLIGVEVLAGRPASVFERVHGPSMWTVVVADPSSCTAMARELAELQQRLFDVVPPVALPAQRDRLASKIRVAARTVDPTAALALALLDDVAGPMRLCHGDLHPDNVIVTSRGLVVIDWFDAARGAPMADVARTSLLLGDAYPQRQLPRHLPGASIELLRRFHAAYREHIAELIELDDRVIHTWQTIEVAARLAEGVAQDGLLDVWRTRRAELSPVS